MLRTFLTLGAGLLLAVAAVFLMNARIHAQLPQLTRAVPANSVALSKVVLVTQDIPFGQPIRRDFLKLVEWPTQYLPDGVFKSIDDVYAGSSETRVALRQIVANEPLIARKVSGHGDRPILSAKLSEAKRAYSIRVNDVSGVSGFLLPGDRVDVLLTRDLGNGKADLATDVILQDLLVLGVDQLTDEDHEKPAVARTATVEVDPSQAQKLALAQEVGTLSLALRAVNSAEKVATLSVRVGDLVEGHRPSASAGPTVMVRHGTDKAMARSIRAD